MKQALPLPQSQDGDGPGDRPKDSMTVAGYGEKAK